MTTTYNYMHIDEILDAAARNVVNAVSAYRPDRVEALREAATILDCALNELDRFKEVANLAFLLTSAIECGAIPLHEVKRVEGMAEALEEFAYRKHTLRDCIVTACIDVEDALFDALDQLDD